VRIDRSDAGFAVEMIESHGWKQTLNSRIPAAMPLFLCRSLELGVEPERICGWRGERTEPALLLRVFGGLAVISQAGPLDRAAWTRPKARSLFALLLARLPNPVDSQQVQDELWPDLGVEEGRNALRVAASYVRKALGVDAIRLEGAQMRLALPSPHWVDHIELRRAVASRDAERCSRALDNLKDGEPLADFAELWCLEAREALQLLRSQAQDIAGISTLRDKP
jgi:two-component SAPR family response regulator